MSQKAYSTTILLFCLVVSGKANGSNFVEYLLTGVTVTIVGDFLYSRIRGNSSQSNFARENNLETFCVMRTLGIYRPKNNNNSSIIPSIGRKAKEKTKEALQNCKLSDFVEKSNLNYECVEEKIFGRRSGWRIVESVEAYALERRKEALQECKLSNNQESKNAKK